MERQFEDQYGRTMMVGSSDHDGMPEAYLKVSDHLGEFCPKAHDLVDIAVALWEAAGQPVPVITPRPDIDTSRPLEAHGVTLSAEPDRVVRIAMDGGTVFREMAPHAARALAGALVAFADAADSEPDPQDVYRLTDLIISCPDGAADSLARHLLASGQVTVTGEDTGNG